MTPRNTLCKKTARRFTKRNSTTGALIFALLVLLLGTANAQQPPFPLTVNMWGYTAGAIAGVPAGVANWTNGDGNLTVTGTQGSGTLAINSVNVGVIGDWTIDTTQGPGWAIVIAGDDGVYRVYSVYAVDTVGMTLSVYPVLKSSVTAQIAGNLYDGDGSPHLTALGYYGLADFVVAQTKATSYIQKYADRYVSDGLGNYAGSQWTAIGGLNQGKGGYVQPTTCMSEGVYPNTATIDNDICNPYSGPDRTEFNGSYYHTVIAGSVAGQGAKQTASLNGRSGYLDTILGIEGQYLSEQASARVQVIIDGVVVVNQNFGGLTHLQVPFTHAQSGEIDVTVDSPYPCAIRVSNTNWFVWDDADWNGTSPDEPLIPNGASVLLIEDSWGVYHNYAFATRLAQDLPSSVVTNVSVNSKTAAWAIANFSSLTVGGPYDYILSDFQINDLHPDLKGITFLQLLANMETLWGMELNIGGTPIYLRSLTKDATSSVQLLNQWDQTLTTNYPTQASQQQQQFISFPSPGTQIYGDSPITLAATATSGLPVNYALLSGPATLSGNVLTITGVGTITVQATQVGNSQFEAATPVSTTFTVNPAVLTVTAADGSMTYGGAVPALSYAMNGFVNGDTQGSATSGAPSESTTATSASPAGSYPISISQGTLTAANYTFSFVSGNMQVNAAVLTVSAVSTGMIYGGAVPTLTYTIAGFVNGDSQGTATSGAPAESTAATSGSPVGNYAINIAQGTLTAANYTFSFVCGAVTVAPAMLTLTADNKVMNEGDSFPTFTASYSGFVNGDNQSVLTGSPSVTTDAPDNPPVGTYHIIPALGTLAAQNYTFTFVNGTLTVNAAVAQLTAPAKNSMLSGSSVNFTWSHETSAVGYQLLLGTTPGGQDIANVATSGLTADVNGLPTDGSYIYATLLGSTDGSTYTVEDTAVYTAYSVTAVMMSPAPGSTFTGNSATFNWVAGAGSSAYWLDVGSSYGGNEYYQSGNLGTALTTTVNTLPTDGSTVYVTLWSLVGDTWQHNIYSYAAYNNASIKGEMASPAPGSTLTGSSQLFTWTAGTQATAYWLDAGNVQGGNQYFQSGNLGNVTSVTATGLPTDGSTVYITLWSLVNGSWVNNQYSYTAYSAAGATGVLTTPQPGSQFADTTVTFVWTAGTQSTAYWLDLGSVPGGNQYHQSGNLGNVTTTTANGLPSDGSTVYATLYSMVGGQWIASSYTFTAYSQQPQLGVIQTPAPGSTLSGNVATFTWSAGAGATAYWMDIGSEAGGNEYYQSGNLGDVLTTTVYSLPADGSPIYVTLYSYIGGQWLSNGYTYTSGP